MTLGPLRFINASGGTSDWVYPGPAIDMQSPASAQAQDTVVYLIYAEALDRSQWEISKGTYTLSSGTFARTTIIANHLGTTAKINFGNPPLVSVFDIVTIPTPTYLSLGIPALMRSYLAGLVLSTAGASSSFSVAAGVATNSTAADIMNLAASITKTTGAWAVGTGNGSFDGTGSAPSATAGWYHVYLIKRPDTGVVDICTSNSATAPTVGGNIPSAYTLFRRIGSMKTNGSFQWIPFLQIGDSFYWQTMVTELASQAVNATPSNVTMAGIPSGVSVRPIFSLWVNCGVSTAAARVRVYSPLLSDNNAARNQSAAISVANGAVVSVTINSEYTNTSAQLRYVDFSADSGANIDIYTMGWIDTRGRDA